MRRYPRMGELRKRLYEEDMDHATLAELLKVSPSYISTRMTGKRGWDLDTVYQACDLLHIPYNEIPKFFPPRPSATTLKGVLQ